MSVSVVVVVVVADEKAATVVMIGVVNLVVTVVVAVMGRAVRSPLGVLPSTVCKGSIPLLSELLWFLPLWARLTADKHLNSRVKRGG